MGDDRFSTLVGSICDEGRLYRYPSLDRMWEVVVEVAKALIAERVYAATLTARCEQVEAVVEAADDEYGFSPRMQADITYLYGIDEPVARRIDQWIVGIEAAYREEADHE
jgi:hypothetical protein